MTRFVAGDWFIGIIGACLIPVSLGLIISARRKMLREIKIPKPRQSDD